MTTAPLHPRRSYKTSTVPSPIQSRLPHDPISTTNLPLRKSSTFHSPTSPPTDDDPILHISLLSRRSPTSPQDLEDVVAAGEHRVASLLSHLDSSLEGDDTSIKTEPADDLPVPRFMLDAHLQDRDSMDIDKADETKIRRKHHTSDSGIGSTITASDDEQDDSGIDDYKKSIPALIKGLQGGKYGNAALGTGVQHSLSAYACRQIQRYIIVPILKQAALKAFHPLIKGIPVRVGRKEITCLRDLEKVLLWLAPRFATSRDAFVKFGETTIQCLHTTVPHLSEPDLRRPADRPYTNGYFLDLTEQIRQYAAMITATRERMAVGQTKEGDVVDGERLVLHGGLTETGRPAELARSKDGKLTSLRTGEPIDVDATLPKSFASAADREEYELSMARRRKNAPERAAQRCAECDKEFKRPCDLTKHEKTHSRPWKCKVSACKYAEYGWPTEKERDRHENDKHSSTPSLFKCQYHPCPYESKRESNCKQHMEKAHGWAYVRSKNNGKSVTGRKTSASKSASSKSPPTPLATPSTNTLDLSGSEMGEPTSPYARTHSRATSTTAASTAELSPFMGMESNFNAPLDQPFAWGEQSSVLTPVSPFTPGGQYNLDQGSSSMDANAFPPSSSYGTSLATDDIDMDPPLFNGTFDWSNMDLSSADFTAMNMQAFTPATSIQSQPGYGHGHGHSRNPSISVDPPIYHLSGGLSMDKMKLSPGAEGSTMLYSPSMSNSSQQQQQQTFLMDDFPLSTGINVNTAGKQPMTTTMPTTMTMLPGDFSLFDASEGASTGARAGGSSNLSTAGLSSHGNSNGPAGLSLFADLPAFQPGNCWDNVMEGMDLELEMEMDFGTTTLEEGGVLM